MIVAVTLNWNRLEDTGVCVASLLEQSVPDLQVVVVDNGSTDGSSAELARRFPAIRLMTNGKNLGFAAGMNVGLRWALAAGAEAVFLVNNDTIAQPGCLRRLIDAARPDDVGAVAPLIVYADRPGIIWANGGWRRPWTLEQTGERRGQRVPETWSGDLDRDFLTGCGLLLKRSLLETVGVFDERFFMYYEDSDLSLRARQAGFRLQLVPEARLRHKVTASSGGPDSPNERYWMARSSMQYLRKHTQGVSWFFAWPWRCGNAARTTLRLLSQGQPRALAAYWRGLRDGWLDPCVPS